MPSHIRGTLPLPVRRILKKLGSDIRDARLSSDNQDENVATIKVRTRGRDATSGKTMAVWGTRSKRMGDGGVSETVGMRRPAART